MRFVRPMVTLSILALALAAAPSLAQTTAPPVRLPDPPVADEAQPSAFVAAARNAIAAGRIGEAREAIERAESRVLIRSVRPSLAGVPSDQAVTRLLAEARRALEQGERQVALGWLAEAAAHPGLDAVVQ
jgi:hypothetical protein